MEVCFNGDNFDNLKPKKNLKNAVNIWRNFKEQSLPDKHFDLNCK